MGRIDELSPYQIAESFPDECKEFIPKALMVFESKLLDIRNSYQVIDSMLIDSNHKKLYRIFVDATAPRKYTKLIERYKKVMEILKKIEDKQYLDNAHKISLARAKPIESFIVLEKQRMGSSRIHGRCPLGTHIDSNPSFVIYRTTNSYHCFSCHANGDSIDLFMRINQVDFNLAINEMSK